jgi:4-hydroxymandelate oxidase
VSLPPLDELVNTLEVEAVAKQKLDAATFALIQGSDRRPFERITFRPRLMVNTTKLDLTLDLFGTKMLAPIVAGPIAQPKRFHPEGEAAIAKGATDAKAVFVVAEQSRFPAGKSDWWYQPGPKPDRARIEQAVAQGCKAFVVMPGGATPPPVLPVVLKGVMSVGQAKEAVAKGAAAIVVSNYHVQGNSQPMDVLADIVDAVGTRIPVLIDSGFRRGTDVMMALALGAKGVLVARPVAWGLATYGADGVRYVLEMLQTELGRTMAMSGRPTLASINRTAIKVHRW